MGQLTSLGCHEHHQEQLERSLPLRFNCTDTNGQFLHFGRMQEQPKNFNSNYEDGGWNGQVEEGGGGMEHEEGDPRENRSKYDEDETVDETSAAPTLSTCEDVQELLL